MNKFSQLFNANIVNICGQSDNKISLESIANDPILFLKLIQIMKLNFSTSAMGQL